MKTLVQCLSIIALCIITQSLQAQKTIFESYHLGIVQPILSVNQGDAHYFYENEFYAIGFPIGLTCRMSESVKFDLEFVPFVKPNADLNKPFEINFLFHPGFLFPLSGGWTFGTRLAFETVGAFGLSPLLNKSFGLGGDRVFFIELVAPARWGPQKNNSYTQALAVHVGLGF